MTATVIPFPSKSVREAVLEARKAAEVARQYTTRPDGWRYLSALGNAEQLVRLALKRTDVQPIPRKLTRPPRRRPSWAGLFCLDGGGARPEPYGSSCR